MRRYVILHHKDAWGEKNPQGPYVSGAWLLQQSKRPTDAKSGPQRKGRPFCHSLPKSFEFANSTIDLGEDCEGIRSTEATVNGLKFVTWNDS